MTDEKFKNGIFIVYFKGSDSQQRQDCDVQRAVDHFLSPFRDMDPYGHLQY